MEMYRSICLREVYLYHVVSSPIKNPPKHVPFSVLRVTTNRKVLDLVLLPVFIYFLVYIYCLPTLLVSIDLISSSILRCLANSK
jgi:hypothetical protein